MRRADVRVVQPQQEEITSVPIVGSEADALLAKYYQEQEQKLIDEYDKSQKDPRTDDNFRGFSGIEVPIKKPHDPRVDADRDGMFHNTSWDGDQESGLNFEIKVTSDMPLPKR
jgi:hypothetical protein